MLAGSTDADFRGAGRGEEWPTGRVAALLPFLDFGLCTIDKISGGFDIDAGTQDLKALFYEAAADIHTTNGPACIAYVPGSRGPPPSVRVYVKAVNAAVIKWPWLLVRTRLMDMPRTAVYEGGAEFVEDQGKVLAWMSTDDLDAHED